VLIHPADETEVQEVCFRSLRRVADQHALSIVNEAGRSFVVNLDSRQVSALPPVGARLRRSAACGLPILAARRSRAPICMPGSLPGFLPGSHRHG